MFKNSEEIEKLREEIISIRGQHPENKRIFWTENIRNQILEFYRQGCPVNRLHSELKISHYTISNWIKASGVKKKTASKSFKEVSVVDKSEKFSTKAVRFTVEVGRLHITIESKDKSELLAFLDRAL